MYIYIYIHTYTYTYAHPYKAGPGAALFAAGPPAA